MSSSGLPPKFAVQYLTPPSLGTQCAASTARNGNSQTGTKVARSNTQSDAPLTVRGNSRTAEPIGGQVASTATSTGHSAASRGFIRETETALAKLLAGD